MAIQRVEAWLVELPMTAEYILSFVRLKSLSLIVMRITFDDCAVVAETMEAPQKFWEQPQECWKFVSEAAPRLIGCSPVEMYGALASSARVMPRCVLPFLTGADLVGVETPASEMRIDLVGVLSAKQRLHTTLAEAEELVASGYRTLKVKIGFGAQSDAKTVNEIAKHTPSNVQLRVDANQAYEYSDAVRFAASITAGERVEAFEQPFRYDDWSGARRLAAECELPLMLDESIYGTEDIYRAANEVGAALVKLKLVKSGGLKRLIEQIEFAKGLGLGVVVGNGVSGEVGCYHEALALNGRTTLAAENNGFLKTRATLLEEPLCMHKGLLDVPAGYHPTFAQANLDRWSVSHGDWH